MYNLEEESYVVTMFHTATADHLRNALNSMVFWGKRDKR